MFDRALLKLVQPATSRLADYAICLRISPTQMSFAGLGLGLFAAALIALGFPGLALVPLLASRLADGIDGEIARGGDEQTDLGAFLDITLDFIFYAAVPLAFVALEPAHNAVAGAVLLAAFLGTGTSFLAYAAVAAKRGETSTAYPQKGIYYLGGLTEGSETLALFVACCLWPSWFAPLAYGFSLLCALTTFMRVLAGWERFRLPPDQSP